MATRRQSRDALLRTLREVFETHGYAGATLTQLAQAAGLGKASLYHHFPGGKLEMAAVLLRESVADLERLAFARLNGTGTPAERLAGFVDGFATYVDNGEANCLVAVFAQGGSAGDNTRTIEVQFGDWIQRLTATFEETGASPKKAAREANALIAGLYGHLTTARLLGDPDLFKKHVKRLKKRLGR